MIQVYILSACFAELSTKLKMLHRIRSSFLRRFATSACFKSKFGRLCKAGRMKPNEVLCRLLNI